MTLVSNDPIWWPLINVNLFRSYFIVAASVGLMYNWALTFEKEVELIWRQRWSLMTFLYLTVRYAGIGYAVINILINVPTISMTGTGCLIAYDIHDWTSDVVDIILGVIMISRLHAMYQQSRKVLAFLLVIFLPIRIANAVMTAIMTTQVAAEEFILSSTYQCVFDYSGEFLFLDFMTWILGTVWEVFALCLAVWIAVKHFHELRQHSTGSITGDCFTVLMKTHVIYFASFVAVPCFHIGFFTPTVAADQYSLKSRTYIGLDQIFQIVQMFELGPRLILGVREYHAELVANYGMATSMTSIDFQERIHVSIDSSV
jgi:preprotein translocase subunit SecG